MRPFVTLLVCAPVRACARLCAPVRATLAALCSVFSCASHAIRTIKHLMHLSESAYALSANMWRLCGAYVALMLRVCARLYASRRS